MDSNPKISIITPIYNSEKYIESTIKSVLDQTYSNWELILIDDFSTDKSIQVIEPILKKNNRVKLIRLETNQGAAVARNEGTKIAEGDYIAFLDSDDLWLPHKLSVQIELMRIKGIDVCFSSYELIDEKGESLNKVVSALPSLSFKKLLKSNYVGNLTGIYDAKKLGKIYAPNLRKRQDWLLWLEALKGSSKNAFGIKEPLARYRIRKDSMSSNKMDLIKYNFKVYRKGLGFSALKSVYCILVFMIEHFFVKSKQIKKLHKT